MPSTTPLLGLERSPGGSGNPIPIIDANWPILDTYLTQNTAMLLRFGTVGIDGKTLATTQFQNLTGYNWLVDKLIFVPLTYTATTGQPTIEVGEDVQGVSSFVAATAMTVANSGNQVQELVMNAVRPLILNNGYLKVTVTNAATGTTALFQIWAKMLYHA